ncbi:hypothetical protein [Streptosporangium sp. NPDC004631]
MSTFLAAFLGALAAIGVSAAVATLAMTISDGIMSCPAPSPTGLPCSKSRSSFSQIREKGQLGSSGHICNRP